MMKRIFSVLLVLVLCLMFFACNNKKTEAPKTKTQETEPPKTETNTQATPELNVKDLEFTLFVGEEKEINYNVINLEGKDLVNISIKDSSILSISGNKVKALKAGATIVTISLKDYSDIKVEVKVTVLEKETLTLTGDGTVYTGESIKLNANLSDVEFRSSNEEVATVDATGLVTGVKSGTVDIICTKGDLTAKLTIKVINNNIEILSNLFVTIDEDLQLSAKLEGYNGLFVWSCSEDSKEYIELTSEGLVTGIKEGTCKITVTAGDISKEFEFTVLGKPELRVEGPTSVYVGYQIQLTAVLINLEGEVTWKSNYPKAAKVDENGLVTCLGAGNVVITCSCGEDYSVRYKIECLVEPDRVDLDFDGGVSEELYFASTVLEKITVHAYGSVGGYYWSNYETHVFIYDRTNDIMPTFSDRIYFGKNPDSGFYEVKGIITSGGSVWPDDAEYVITYSSSYNSYRAFHSITTGLELGDIVFLTRNPSELTNSINLDAYIFSKTPDTKIVTIDKADYKGLPNPTKLGYEFDGWLNTKTNEVVKELSEVKGIIPLVAQWKELNPVTDITLLNMQDDLIVGETLTVTGKVSPDDAYFKTVFYSSSNEDVCTIDKDGLITAVNGGTCNIIVTDYVGKVTKSYPITVYPHSQMVVSFATKHFDGNMEVDENVTIIPTYFGKDYGKCTFTYLSSNTDVLSVDENGRMTALSGGISNVTIKGKCESLSEEFELVININVNQLNDETRIDSLLKLIAENNFSVVAMGNACLYDDGTNKYYKATYGSVNNYLFSDLFIDRSQAEIARNNQDGHKDRTAWHGGIEFVTVHDTATLTSTAQSTAASMATGTTSIHYTTGNGVVCQCVPEEYIAYHAGDGTGVQFQWYASGVMADGLDIYDFNTYPVFDLEKVDKVYYFTINGTRSKIPAPTGNGSKTISNPSKENLSDLGPVWKVVNGEYYLGTTWVDFSQMAIGCIGSHGGNNNSIGIEMGVGTASNMYDTWLRTSKLVADICIRNNLDISRVKQHNTWTGKNCPQCLRAGGNWWDFMEMVRIEYIIMSEYSDLTITLSTDSNIINKEGLVVRAPKTTEVVNYTVTVSNGTTEKSITLSSVVPGTDTWTKLNGVYKTNIIWNNGYFDLNRDKR